jgi:hypothetical protein
MRLPDEYDTWHVDRMGKGVNPMDTSPLRHAYRALLNAAATVADSGDTSPVPPTGEPGSRSGSHPLQPSHPARRFDNTMDSGYL